MKFPGNFQQDIFVNNLEYFWKLRDLFPDRDCKQLLVPESDSSYKLLN